MNNPSNASLKNNRPKWLKKQTFTSKCKESVIEKSQFSVLSICKLVGCEMIQIYDSRTFR
jgi:hypothetical protein